MRVLVTGGTGFVGAHSVKALLDAGHEVRLLVRAPDRIAAALGPLGIGSVDHVVGDVTDPGAVRRALDGCEAVLHAAGVYALARGRAAEMGSVNARGTEVVLGAAHALGLDPIVHVSSYSALLPPGADGVLTADAPVGHPAGPYARSKAEAESIARRLQQLGAPVTITQPGTVWGPHDPHMGESARIAMTILRGRMPIALPGPLAIVDVRDVANVHTAVMRRGLGPRRFLVVAADVMFADLIDTVRRATGRRLPAVGFAAGLARRTIGARRSVPGNLEGPWIAMQGARCDGSATEAALGLSLRPPEESVTDTIRWLHATGELDDRRAGRIARQTSDRDSAIPSTAGGTGPSRWAP